MDFSLHGKVAEHQAAMERQKAVETARYPAFSKYGSTLMSIGIKRNKDLHKTIDSLNRQMNQIEIEMRWKKKYFLKNCHVLNYDPIILLDRPSTVSVADINLSKSRGKEGPSPAIPTSAYYIPDDYQIFTRPCSKVTTDAFAIKTRKKKNIWEPDKENGFRQFKSMTSPFPELTPKYHNLLCRRLSFNKPHFTPDQIIFSSSVRPTDSEIQVKKITSIDLHTNYEHCSLKKLTRNSGSDGGQSSQKRSIKSILDPILNLPMAIFERPPSPEVIKKAVQYAYSDEDDDTFLEPENSPHYMKQLRSKVKTPSLLTTIDAFTIKNSKKKNVWEEATDDKEPMKFQSTVRPYARLTKREQSDLQVGWSFHKPRLTPEHTIDNLDVKSSSAKSDSQLKRRKSIENYTNDKHFSTEKLEDSEDEDSLTPFITQMAKVRSQSGVKNDNSKNKSLDQKTVRFSRSATNTPVKKNRLKSTKHSVVEINA